MSEGRADLHCHTTASDGTFSPHELVREAAKRGLSAIAVTDHDSVDSVREAMDAGRCEGVEVVPGVEISTDVDSGEVHVLGYYLDCRNEEFLQVLARQRQSRMLRVQQMIEKLSDLGVNITFEQVLSYAGHGAVGRPHVAAALINAGYVGSWDDAFSRYIGRHAPAYVRRSKLTPVDAVEHIRSAGGVAVLAHPGLSNQDHMIPALVEAGLGGVEAVYPDHSPTQQRHYEEIAREYSLVVTGGSDCHGPKSKSGVVLGSCTVGVDVLSRLAQSAGNGRDGAD